MTSALRLARIEAAIAALFPAGVAVGLCELATADPRTLMPEERAAMAGAIPHRLVEFAAGRQAARIALVTLGRPPAALPMGPDRAPIWPQGISGSISHAAGIAIAVARPGAPLGVDIEEDTPLAPDLWTIITSDAERAGLPDGDTGTHVRSIFAAKEAVFKAQSPEDRALFGFDAVEVTLANGGFDATFRIGVGAFARGATVRGRLARIEGLVLAGVAR